MVSFMASDNEGELSGLVLLNQPATPALVKYLDDLVAMIAFQAYLWKMIIRVDYGGNIKAPVDSPLPPESAYAEMQTHSEVLSEMVFCRAVNSFQTYLTDLLTLIFLAKPETLKSQKKVTREFCVEHHTANDLISALAEQTVTELAYQNIHDLATFFDEDLKLPLFTRSEDLELAALCVDIRNIITHNRGFVNRFFAQRHPDYAEAIGQRITLSEKFIRDKTATLGVGARRLDIRAAKKFTLETIKPILRNIDETTPIDSHGNSV